MKAALPQMRTQKSGLINITSIAGYRVCRIGPFILRPGALELITEALRMEVKSFGIHITNVAPGDFATNTRSLSCTCY
jgi:NAD(P)-dependent dehydrogenase (short-subunit alcohol dehydrogenase family)